MEGIIFCLIASFLFAMNCAVLADDPPSKSLIYARAKYLANSVQCVHINERPTPQPKRLTVSSVVTQLLGSVLDGVDHAHKFLTTNLTVQEDALKLVPL